MSTSEARVGARSLDDQADELGAALSARIPQLAKAIAEAIRRDIQSYAVALSSEELTRSVVSLDFRSYAGDCRRAGQFVVAVFTGDRAELR